MKFQQARTLACAAVAALGALTLAPAHAQSATDWPARPVTLVNPFAAGSAVDVVARLVATKMTENLGQAINVENRTGASGNIGTEYAARAKPDGYTLLLGSPGTMAINPWTFQKLPYDAQKSFAPVSQMVSFPQVVIAHPKGSIKSIPDLIKAAQADPGGVTHGSSGQGTTSHLVMELIKADAKIKMNHISYRGGAPTVLAVTTGEVQTGVEGIPALMGQIKSGNVLPLAVTSDKRSPLLPDVPSMAEFLPGFDASAWILLMAPAGTPPELVSKISTEVRRALQDPDVRAKLEAQGATVVGSTPEQAAKFHEGELRKFKRAVEISGTKAVQ